MTIRVDGVVWMTATGLGKDAADIDHFWSGWDRNGDYRGSDGFDLMTFLASGNDKIYGSANGDDLFSGRNPGNDSLYGGGGDDFIKGDPGNDLVSGGTGWDTFSLSESLYDGTAGRGAIVNLALGTATDCWGGKDTLTGIEEVEGSRFRDKITGSGRDEKISGLKGADTLAGGGGYDQLEYGRDEDRGGARGVTVNLATGRAVDGWGNTDIISGFEEARGTAQGDTLIGNAGSNQFIGRDGDDVLIGGGGNDTLSGDSGEDSLTGGIGSDVFVFGGWDGTQPFGDVITDFVSGTDDLYFDTGSIAGMDDTLRFNTGAAATGTGSSFFFDPANSTLYWDADGTGGTAAVIAVVLTGVTSLAQGDITLG